MSALKLLYSVQLAQVDSATSRSAADCVPKLSATLLSETHKFQLDAVPLCAERRLDLTENNCFTAMLQSMSTSMSTSSSSSSSSSFTSTLLDTRHSSSCRSNRDYSIARLLESDHPSSFASSEHPSATCRAVSTALPLDLSRRSRNSEEHITDSELSGCCPRTTDKHVWLQGTSIERYMQV